MFDGRFTLELRGEVSRLMTAISYIIHHNKKSFLLFQVSSTFRKILDNWRAPSVSYFNYHIYLIGCDVRKL